MVNRTQRQLNTKLIVLGVIGFVSGLGTFWVASHAAYQQPKIPSPPVALLVGWSLLGSGLLSWRARPDNRLGPVMVLTGFAWFASVLQEGNGAAVATIGFARAARSGARSSRYSWPGSWPSPRWPRRPWPTP